jgi:hypothetical protein
MTSSGNRFCFIAFVTALSASLVPIPANAQFKPRGSPNFGAYQGAVNSTSFGNPNFRINPNLTLNQAAFNTAVLGQAASQVPPFASLQSLDGITNPYTASLSTSPYGDFVSYGNSSTNAYGFSGDPFAQGLMGSADIVNAQGTLLLSNEQSWMMHEQGRQAKIQTRRKLFDEYRYERENTASSEDLRQMERQTLYRRSIANPAASEIASGSALNILMDHINDLQASGSRGPSVSLDDSIIKQISVRPEGRTENCGLLKDANKLGWPSVLLASVYEKERNRIQDFLLKAIQQCSSGRVEDKTINTLRADVESLQERLSGNVHDLGTGKYMEGKRFLNSLDEAVQALGQTDAIKYFNHEYELKGKTVAEMISNMKDKGLRFAPSVIGRDTAYRSLYEALITYDASLGNSLPNRKVFEADAPFRK